MRRIIGGCLSQFHDDKDTFELLLAYSDGREVGHVIGRETAQTIACGMLAAIEYELPSCFTAAPNLLAVVKEYVTEEWSHLDDDDLQIELSKGNEMVRNHIAARAAIAKAEGRA